MKEYYLVVLCLILLLIVTGCGKNQVTCTAITNVSGVSLTAKVVGDLDEKDVITDIVVIYELDDKSVVEPLCDYIKKIQEPKKEVTVSCSENAITVNGMASVTDDDDESVIGLTKEKFIQKAEQSNGVKFTCK